MDLPRKIGFEIEINGLSTGYGTSAITEILRQAGSSSNGPSWTAFDGSPLHNVGSYNSSGGQSWDVKTDASCGYEVASPALTSYESVIKAAEVGQLLSNGSCTVDSRCGFHVHIDCRGLSRRALGRVFRLFTRYEKAFFFLAGSSRQTNHFCKRIDQTKINSCKKVEKSDSDSLSPYSSSWSSDKNYWLNPLALHRHGTLENRLMESSLDPAFICGWSLFNLMAFDWAASGKKVGWGVANCSSDLDLFQTMLGQAGFYGPWTGREHIVPLTKVVRKWALHRVKTHLQDPKLRITPPTIQDFREALASAQSI